MVKAVKNPKCGVSAEAVAQDYGITRAALYNRSLSVSHAKGLKVLEDKNLKRKQMYADMASDNRI